MIEVSDRFLTALRETHTISVAARVYVPSAPTVPIQVPIVDGSLTLDADARVRRQAGVEVAFAADDPFTLDVIEELPFGGTCVIERGIAFADETVERVALGLFRVDAVVYDAAFGTASLTLSDRMVQVQDEPLLSPWAPAGLKPSNAVVQAVTEVFGESIDYHVETTPSSEPTLTGGTIYDQDRAQAIADLAASVDAEVLFDNEGDFVIRPRSSGGDPVWTLDAGQRGVLVAASEALDRSNVRNGVAVRAQGEPNTPPIFALATNDDALSPTRWGGPFGKVAMIVTLTGVSTQAQADATAESLLRLRLGLSRTLSLAGVPNPALEPGDVIEVAYPDGRSEEQTINSINLGLGVGGTLSMTTTSTV